MRVVQAADSEKLCDCLAVGLFTFYSSLSTADFAVFIVGKTSRYFKVTEK